MEHTLTPTLNPPDTTNQTDVSEAVILAIAEAEGVSPLEVYPPMATVVDPDALNNLVASMNDESTTVPCTIEFGYSGYGVTVTGDGDVSVSELED